MIRIVYHQFPHYRAAVLRALSSSNRFEYQFWGSCDEVNGIVPFGGDDVVKIEPLKFRTWGKLWILSGYSAIVFDRSARVLIILGNPNMPASWLMAIAGRCTGKVVFFWAHGWLRKEGVFKRRFRNFYFSLANHLLVYGERSREIGISEGFATERITTIYNSLDFDIALSYVRLIEDTHTQLERPQRFFSEPSRPVIICTARLTALCRFDLLFEAAVQLGHEGQPINILLVGDGPERAKLEAMAARLGVDVHFYGACYDETVLSRLIYFSDLTVSPGKIGLSVIHSLSYGTPAISHSDLDSQMPEVEAIKVGVTGDLFERGDSKDLARKIALWLNSGRSRDEVRGACQDEIRSRWTAEVQRQLIEKAIAYELRKRGVAE